LLIRFFLTIPRPSRPTLFPYTTLFRSQGIYAYTAIHAPRGLNERIFHVWIHNGKVIDRVALQISGVREEGYRSWSHKQNFPANPDRKSTRLNSSHVKISYAVFCLKKKK